MNYQLYHRLSKKREMEERERMLQWNSKYEKKDRKTQETVKSKRDGSRSKKLKKKHTKWNIRKENPKTKWRKESRIRKRNRKGDEGNEREEKGLGIIDNYLIIKYSNYLQVWETGAAGDVTYCVFTPLDTISVISQSCCALNCVHQRQNSPSSLLCATAIQR